MKKLFMPALNRSFSHYIAQWMHMEWRWWLQKCQYDADYRPV